MRKTYHHGDARSALIAAGLRHLETTPATELSLRQVAETAGLSRQAPYRHFADKEDLLAALAEAGFAELARRIEAAAGAQHYPEAALAAAAAIYIAFARELPQRFRLMFSRELVDLSRFPAAAAAGAAAYAGLERIVTAAVGEERAATRALAAWALVHGYAALSIELEVEAPEHLADRARQFAQLIVAAETTAP